MSEEKDAVETKTEEETTKAEKEEPKEETNEEVQEGEAEEGEEEEEEEARIRGGGKVTSDGGRNNRRYAPYRSGGNSGGGGGSGDSGEEDSKSRRVYVGNLSWNVSWQDLKDHMRSAGEVTRADIMTGADGRSKGCGIVEYANEEGAKEAVLTLNDTELNGRQIFVREDREDRGGSGGSGNRFSADDQAQTRRVYVGNLSWDVAWQDLKDHMRDAGEVVHAEVITEANGRSKGCGIVEYATSNEAKEAISTLNDTELKGRMIFVREDRESNSGAYHGAPGSTRGSTSVAGTSVYVWNLDYETSWQDLKDHCRGAGNVDQATILTNPDGRSLGCGVVVYQNPKEAARAIRELQNSELNGRPMYLRKDRVQNGGRGRGGGGRGGGRYGGRGGGGRGGGGGGESSGCQLFVGNLSFDTSWQTLKDHFRQVGDVEHVEVMETPDGKKRGFGTVKFASATDAEAAIKQLNGVELQGRSLEVRLDHKA